MWFLDSIGPHMTNAAFVCFGRNSSRAVESVPGYKRRIGASWFTSALHPAPEIRTQKFRS